MGTREDPWGPAPHSRIVFKRHVIRLQKSGPVKKSIFFVKFVKLIFSSISSRKRRITLEIALVSVEIACGAILETCLKWKFGLPFPPKKRGISIGNSYVFLTLLGMPVFRGQKACATMQKQVRSFAEGGAITLPLR